MWKTTLRAVALLIAVALVAVLAVQMPAVADDGEDEVKKVRVRKVIRDCDGEDCDESEHHAIFVGEDGEIQEIGEGNSWVMAGDHEMHAMHHGPTTYLGVELTELNNELRAHFGTPADQGVLVARVADGSPAAIAGVQVGDVITAVDGESVGGAGSLGRLIRQRDEGETVALELYRDGRIETLSPTLAQREAPKMKMRRLHGPGHGAHAEGRQVMVRCESEGDDAKNCEVTVGGDEMAAFDCGGAESCEVQVECNDGDCECTANGDAVDCDSLPGFSERHGD